MAELKTAEGRPVRDASLCPRCRPWPHHARAHPTAAIDLPDQPTRVYLFTGVVSDLGRRGGRRGGRGGLSPPPLRVDPGAAMLRATRPGGGRRINPSSCPGAQAGWPLSEAGPRPAMQPPGSLREAQGGTQVAACEGAQNPAPRSTMVITIVVHVATVSRGVKRND